MRYPFFLLVCIFLLQAGCGGDEKPTKPVSKDDKKAKPIEPEGPGGGKMR